MAWKFDRFHLEIHFRRGFSDPFWDLLFSIFSLKKLKYDLFVTPSLILNVTQRIKILLLFELDSINF